MVEQETLKDTQVTIVTVLFLSPITQADCFSNDIHKLDTSTMTWTLVCTKVCPGFS